MVRPSRRGGVPVLRRQPRRPSCLRDSPRRTAAGSPERPAGYCCSPQWIRPLRKVPVVMMIALAPTVRPSRSLIPRQMRTGQSSVVGRWSLARAPVSAGLANDERPTTNNCSTIRSATSACLIFRFGCDSKTSRIFRRYACLSHCARGDQTAGPREVFSSRNCIPTASVISPMIPPRASTSRTKCPLAMPPTAGLHDICAIRSTLRVYSAVLRPMRAAAIAASHPAWPAPTTTTSNCSVNCIPRNSITMKRPTSLFFHSSNLKRSGDPRHLPIIILARIVAAGGKPEEEYMTTAEFFQELNARLAKYDLLCHPFYKAWSAGRLTREDLREYAQDYYHHVEAFPSYLAALGLRLEDGRSEE